MKTLLSYLPRDFFLSNTLRNKKVPPAEAPEMSFYHLSQKHSYLSKFQSSFSPNISSYSQLFSTITQLTISRLKNQLSEFADSDTKDAYFKKSITSLEHLGNQIFDALCTDLKLMPHHIMAHHENLAFYLEENKILTPFFEYGRHVKFFVILIGIEFNAAGGFSLESFEDQADLIISIIEKYHFMTHAVHEKSTCILCGSVNESKSEICKQCQFDSSYSVSTRPRALLSSHKKSLRYGLSLETQNFKVRNYPMFHKYILQTFIPKFTGKRRELLIRNFSYEFKTTYTPSEKLTMSQVIQYEKEGYTL